MSIVLLVLTDGRRSCLVRSIPSALENLRGPITHRVICDDSADPDYQSWLHRTFSDFDIVCGPERLGFGGNIRRAWNYLRNNADARFVWHAEDDFTYNRPIDLRDMMQVLDDNPHLLQLVLRRQPWNDQERKAGGVVEQWPDAYDDCSDGTHEWLEHRLFWTTNPSLYRMDLCYQEWPETEGSESRFTIEQCKDPTIYFGFWGARNSGEWVSHIGGERVGVGY